MRKVCIRFIVLGIIIRDIYGAAGCTHPELHLQSKCSDVIDRHKRGSILGPYYDSDDRSNEAREQTSEEIHDFIPKISLKTKGNLQESSTIFLPNDMLDPDNDHTEPQKLSNEENNEETTKPYINIQATTNPNEFRKEKRNTVFDDPIDISIINSREKEQKNYKCICKVLGYPGKKCRNQGLKASHHWKRNMHSNVKDYIDNAHRKSAEDNIGAYSNDHNKVFSVPLTVTEPMKFHIPFANNINFDQRVILADKNFPARKHQKIGLVYQNPVYHPYNGYVIEHPGIIYEAFPFRPTYPPMKKSGVPVPNGDISNVLGSNHPNIEECIKLYGRTVCGISAPSKPATTKVETIDLSDDHMYAGEEESSEKPSVYRTKNQYQPYSAATPQPNAKILDSLPREVYKNHHYDAAVGNTNLMNTNLNNYNSMPQITPSIEATTAVYNYANQPTHYENINSVVATHLNNPGVQNPHYLYTADVYARTNTDTTMGFYNKEDYNGKNIARQEATYTNSAGSTNEQVGTNYYANAKPHEANNLATANVIVNDASSPQYNTGNSNINNNNQYETARITHDYINYNEPTIQSATQENSFSKSQPNVEQNENINFQVHKSVSNFEQNILSQNKSEYTVLSQNISGKEPLMDHKTQQNIVIQPPEFYGIENPIGTDKISVKNINDPEHILQPVTTLEDVETSDYKTYFNDERSVTPKNEDELIQEQTDDINLDNGNLSVAQPMATKTQETVNLEQPSYFENIDNTQKPIYRQPGNLSTENSKQLNQSNLSNPETTETLIQSVDDRPAVTCEDNSEEDPENNSHKPCVTKRNIALVQGAIKKVINNYVPGKAQDLLSNYGKGSSSELVETANTQELLPEILSIPILKNLFSLPEIEDMITDTAGHLLYQVTGSPIIGDIPHLIRNTLHSVISQIPRPHPTVAPETLDEKPTIVEHKFDHRIQVTESIPLYETNPTTEVSKEIYDKIESILYRSQLEYKVITQPIVQNLIVKAVKHAFDKERGVIDESVIRNAFDTLIKSKAQRSSKFVPVTEGILIQTKPLIPQPTATTPINYVDYNLLQTVPVTERLLKVDTLSQSQNYSTEKFNEQQVNTLNLNNEFASHETKLLNEQTLNDVNVKRTSETSKIEAESFATNEKLGNERSEFIELSAEDKDQSIERNPIKYYSPNDRILEYIKNHPSTENPLTTVTANIVGITSDDHNDSPKPLIGNLLSQSISKEMQLESTDIPARSKHGTEQNEQASIDSTDMKYMGKLVPFNYKTSSQTDLQNSNLMYVGDGVRLPLTLRNAPDGSFILTLSDEVCKQFQNKDCPCCLPSDSNGVIVRGTRSGDHNEGSDETSEIDFNDDTILSSSEESTTELGRFRRNSEEAETKSSVEILNLLKSTRKKYNGVNKFIDDEFETKSSVNTLKLPKFNRANKFIDEEFGTKSSVDYRKPLKYPLERYNRANKFIDKEFKTKSSANYRKPPKYPLERYDKANKFFDEEFVTKSSMGIRKPPKYPLERYNKANKFFDEEFVTKSSMGIRKPPKYSPERYNKANKFLDEEFVTKSSIGIRKPPKYSPERYNRGKKFIDQEFVTKSSSGIRKPPKYTREELNRAHKFIDIVNGIGQIPKASRRKALLSALNELLDSRPTDFAPRSRNTDHMYQTGTARYGYENDRRKKDIKRVKKFWDSLHTDEDDSPIEADYGILNDLINSLKEEPTVDTETHGPFRYQQEAEESFKTRMAKRALYLMHNLATIARENRNLRVRRDPKYKKFAKTKK